jgi:NADPH2:quinone reductase
MKAAFIEQTGPPSVIRYGDLPKPTASGSQVLVKVGAVSVNPIDTYIRNGANYWELPKPFIIGCDLAGTVEAVGSQVTRFQPGDRVWGSCQGVLGRQGTFAEYCAVDECWLYPTPAGVSDETAAANALVGITAHLGLFRVAKIQQGETLFVQGGSGGVGAMVVQMAKAAGARVFATGGSHAKVQLGRQLGADAAVNYQTQNVDDEARRFAPDGFHVFWETQRTPDFDKIVSYLAPRGRIILMAGRDARPVFPVGPFYVKECSLHGFVMFKATPDEMRACAEDMNRWMAAGKLKANIAKTFPLAEAAAAHQLQEDNTLAKSGTLSGKIVLNLPGK